MLVFVLVAGMLLLSPEEPDALADLELDALMSAPDTTETLPSYFYEVSAQRTVLTLVSDPEGATVSLNAESAGRTPLHLDALRPGYYAIRVTHPAYFPLDTTLYLASGALYEVDVALTERPVLALPEPEESAGAARAERSATPAGGGVTSSFSHANPETIQRVWHTGSLSATSTPSGARVLVDGQPRGLTPISVNGLRPGDHTVTLQLRGHDPLTYTVQVEAGSVYLLQAAFER